MKFRKLAELLTRRSSVVSAPADLPAVVAANAVLVEHRLHFPPETEAAWRSVPGGDVDRRMLAGKGRLARRTRILGLVTSDARKHFARHRGEPTAHHLECAAVGVEGLHGDGRVGRDAETGRAIRLHGHGAENAAAVPRAVDADVDVSAHAGIRVVRFVDAQSLHGAARHAGQARTTVDIGQVHDGIVAVQVDFVGNDGRRCGCRSGTGSNSA